MTVRSQANDADSQFPPYDEDDEDRLSTVIMADRTGDGRAVAEMLRPGAAPSSRRSSGPGVEAEGVLVDDEPTPDTEKRLWPAAGLTPSVHEWEVTEQMPMPSATPPHLQRAVTRPLSHSATTAQVPPLPPTIERAAIVQPTFDITPEVPRRGREVVAPEWSEVSETPATLNNQPTFDDEDNSFVPLVAMLAVPAFAVFFAAMWLMG